MKWAFLITGISASAKLDQLGWTGETGQDSKWRAVVEPGDAMPYEPPRVLVIGDIREITGGSASNGKKDANSQYYW
jgi:hypothetical protein